jgi:hypothetical protein
MLTFSARSTRNCELTEGRRRTHERSLLAGPIKRVEVGDATQNGRSSALQPFSNALQCIFNGK